MDGQMEMKRSFLLERVSEPSIFLTGLAEFFMIEMLEKAEKHARRLEVC